MRPKKYFKFTLGDKVVTTRDRDSGGNELFPIGTKGVITGVFKDKLYPYRVENEDGDFWYYDEEMLKAEKDEHDIDAYLIAGEVLEKTNGDNAKINEVIYYLGSFINY